MNLALQLLEQIGVVLIALATGAIAVYHVIRQILAGALWIKKKLFDRLDDHEERIKVLEGEEGIAE